LEKKKEEEKTSCVEFTELIHSCWLWGKIKTRPRS